MRADRLISVLLVLQRRGHATVAQVADELGISERTARRDLEALGLAGLPVYSTAGRGGGWRLQGGGRIDLSGLSSPEAVALFASVGSSGTSAQTKAALRKLTRALPQSMRDTAERAATSIRVRPDAGQFPSFGETDAATLAAAQDSVVRAVRAELTYLGRDGESSTRMIDPWALVAQGNRWYLIAGTDQGQRTFRVDRIERYRLTDEPAPRPEDFDVDAVWTQVSAGIDDIRWNTTAEVRIVSEAVRRAQYVLQDRLTVGGPSQKPGWTNATVRGRGVLELVALLAGLHPWLVVESPVEVRQALAELGQELVDVHAGADDVSSKPRRAMD